MNVQALILAAGNSKRMKSDRAKCMHELCGRSMIEYVVRAAREASDEPPFVVVGYHADEVRGLLGDAVTYVEQTERLGTGHAIRCAQDAIAEDGVLIVIACDMPLVRGETLRRLADHIRDGASAAMLTAHAEDPTGYGRVIRDGIGRFSHIVEQRDATPEEAAIREISVLTYAFRIRDLREALPQMRPANAQNEYYATDLLGILKGMGRRVDVCEAPFAECEGVNDRVQMALAEGQMRDRLLRALMLGGAHVVDPSSTYVEPDVRVGRDVVIYPGNVLQGNTAIGDGVTLLPGNRIRNSTIGAGATVERSVLLDAVVGERTTVGPFAYLRPGTVVGAGCRVGDFVEMKNATLGDGAKVSHLAYVGDADVEERVNVSCGVVFSNYDGKRKARCRVKRDAFVGCNVNLIAPVTVGEGAYVAAGSTVTDDVPDEALCVARERQVVKEGWARRRREEGRL